MAYAVNSYLMILRINAKDSEHMHKWVFARRSHHSGEEKTAKINMNFIILEIFDAREPPPFRVSWAVPGGGRRCTSCVGQPTSVQSSGVCGAQGIAAGGEARNGAAGARGFDFSVRARRHIALALVPTASATFRIPAFRGNGGGGSRG